MIIILRVDKPTLTRSVLLVALVAIVKTLRQWELKIKLMALMWGEVGLMVVMVGEAKLTLVLSTRELLKPTKL